MTSMTPEMLNRIMRSRVAGVTGDDLRREISYIFTERRNLIPEPERGKIEDMLLSDRPLLSTILDIAAIAAQCRLRRQHGLPEPFKRD